MTLGVIYFFIIYVKYRNSGARHKYELETKTVIDNLTTIDDYIRTRTGLSNATMEGANNTAVYGKNFKPIKRK